MYPLPCRRPRPGSGPAPTRSPTPAGSGSGRSCWTPGPPQATTTGSSASRCSTSSTWHPPSAAKLIQHYQDYCRAAIRHQQTETADLKNWLAGMHSGGTDRTPFVTAAGLHDAIQVMNHTISTWQSEYEWAQQLASNHNHDTSPE